MTNPRCEHRPPPDLSYLNDLDDAERRIERRERQGYCPHCCKWLWSYLFNSRTAFAEALDAGEPIQREIRRVGRACRRAAKRSK